MAFPGACGGSLGAAWVRWIFPGYSLATRCHARTTRTACAAVLQPPADGLTKPWCLLVACHCHVGGVSSHVPQQCLCCTCRKNVCAKPTPPPPPSTHHQIHWKSLCIKHVSVWLQCDYSRVPSILQIGRNIFLVEKPCIPEVFSLIKLLPYHRSWLLFL